MYIDIYIYKYYNDNYILIIYNQLGRYIMHISYDLSWNWFTIGLTFTASYIVGAFLLAAVMGVLLQWESGGDYDRRVSAPPKYVYLILLCGGLTGGLVASPGEFLKGLFGYAVGLCAIWTLFIAVGKLRHGQLS